MHVVMKQNSLNGRLKGLNIKLNNSDRNEELIRLMDY